MTESKFTLPTRINYLKNSHGFVVGSISKFEANLLRNLLEMPEADRNAIPQVALLASLDKLKAAANEVSVVLNDIAKNLRAQAMDQDIPL